MEKKALFVGVNDYKDDEIRNLHYALDDARSLHDIFEELGYKTAFLKNPGQGEILSQVRKMTEGLSVGDQFVFYFSGHGFTDDGQHLLFCVDDVYANLRYKRAGMPFELLEEETRKCGCDRVFMLDACRSDFLTGTRGADTTTKDLCPISHMVPKGADAIGAFYVLRSCSRYEHAFEIDKKQHGLFTLAMMEIIRESKNAGSQLLFNDMLRETVEERMSQISRNVGLSVVQTPESEVRGRAQILINGRNGFSGIPSYSVASLVTCPICGKKNKIEDTFKCRQCGSDNLCLRHQDEKTFLCFNCADAKRESVKTDASSSKISKVGNKIYEGSSSGNEPDSVKIIVKVSPELGGEVAVDYDSAQDLYDRAENYYRGQNGVKEDRAKAFELYKKASELGHAESQYSLGYMYAYGECTAKDEEKALFWYRKAAKQGHEKARRMVEGIESRRRPSWGFGSYSAPSPQSMSAKDAYERGENYYYGRNGFGQDYAEAVKWYRKAAEQGYARAQCDLGFMYENGRGVTKKDDYEAVKWYRKAADQGNASAQCNLGFMYDNGRGVTKDESEAVKWFRKAADQGHARSQCNLGIMYDYGKGIKQDFFEAIKWYRKAADSGFATAQFCIGLMYDRGRGFQQNYEEAAVWYRKAISNGHEKAKEFLKVIEKRIAEGSRNAAKLNVLQPNTAVNTVKRVQLWKDGPYWADRNIGAENPWDSGYYFWWGDTIGYKRVNDKWVASDGSNSNFSFEDSNAPTHNKSSSSWRGEGLMCEGWVTEKGVLAPAHDAAQKQWGGNWRMPTRWEFDNLNSQCDWIWTTMNGVDGYVVRGRGDYASQSIFLPCAGYGLGTSLNGAGSGGDYWSSSDGVSYSCARRLYFNSGYHSTNDSSRYGGQPVRPVQDVAK